MRATLKCRRVVAPCAAIVSCAIAMGCSAPTLPPPISRPISAQLQDAYASTSWLTYGHDYSNRRFSVLEQINTRDVSSLVPAYVVQTGVVGPLETTPIVSDGVMYLTTAFDGVLAIDARTGDQLWKRPPLSGRLRLCCGPVNRGVAVTNDLVLLGQLDGVLVALDRKTGDLRWLNLRSIARALVKISVHCCASCTAEAGAHQN
jgi:glucose dehydrogenase